jgi:hypothetical protein
LIDGRNFSDVIDIKARRGWNIDSDHMLVVIELRYTISRARNTTPQHQRRFAVERLNDRKLNVATMYRHELEAKLSGASEPEPLKLDNKCKRMEEAGRKVATNTIDFTRKQAGKECLDAIQRRMRATSEKLRQLDEEALIEIE